MIPRLLRCQGFAVVHYSFTLDALDPGHPRLSLSILVLDEGTSPLTLGRGFANLLAL